MPGARRAQPAVRHQTHVQARREDPYPHLEQQLVGALQDRARPRVLPGVRAQRRAHLAHEPRRVQVVALHVADDERRAAVLERHHVVPVAAHVESGRRRVVQRRQLHPRDRRQYVGEHVALDEAREFDARLLEPDPLQGLTGERAEGPHQGAVALRERPGLGEGDDPRAEPPARPQRHHREGLRVGRVEQAVRHRPPRAVLLAARDEDRLTGPDRLGQRFGRAQRQPVEFLRERPVDLVAEDDPQVPVLAVREERADPAERRGEPVQHRLGQLVLSGRRDERRGQLPDEPAALALGDVRRLERVEPLDERRGVLRGADDAARPGETEARRAGPGAQLAVAGGRPVPAETEEQFTAVGAPGDERVQEGGDGVEVLGMDAGQEFLRAGVPVGAHERERRFALQPAETLRLVVVQPQRLTGEDGPQAQRLPAVLRSLLLDPYEEHALLATDAPGARGADDGAARDGELQGLQRLVRRPAARERGPVQEQGDDAVAAPLRHEASEPFADEFLGGAFQEARGAARDLHDAALGGTGAGVHEQPGRSFAGCRTAGALRGGGGGSHDSPVRGERAEPVRGLRRPVLGPTSPGSAPARRPATGPGLLELRDLRPPRPPEGAAISFCSTAH